MESVLGQRASYRYPEVKNTARTIRNKLDGIVGFWALRYISDAIWKGEQQDPKADQADIRLQGSRTPQTENLSTPGNFGHKKTVHRRYFSELSVLYGNCSDEIEKDRNCTYC